MYETQSKIELTAYPTNGSSIAVSNKHIGAKIIVGNEITFFSNTMLSKVLRAKHIMTIEVIQISVSISREIISLKSSIMEVYF